jgi:hypothetical protein
MSNAPLDENSRQGLIGLASDGSGVIVPVYVNKTTHAILTSTSTLTGPVSSTDSAVVLWDGTTGLTVKNSKVIINSSGIITTYANIPALGWGVMPIYAQNRLTAQTAAATSVATYTVGAADGSFLVSGNVNVTAFTSGSFTFQVVYTSESNSAITANLNGHFISGYTTSISGAGSVEMQPIQIRALAGSTITLRTAGTFTNLTYNVEGTIMQIA